MENTDISIMSFDKETKMFCVFGIKELNLKAIPRIGEKLIFDTKEEAFIAEVIDVHYGSNGGVDVFIEEGQPYVDYKAALDSRYLHTLDKRQEA